MINLLTDLLHSPAPPPFALLRRAGRPGVELLLGDVVDVPRLADIPLPEPGPRPNGPGGSSGAVPHVLALVPYRQVTERGFVCHDDHQPLRCLAVRDYQVLDVDDVLAALPDEPLEVTGGAFDLDDDAYAGVVSRVVAEEIGLGEGANFVIRRDFRATLNTPPPQAALRLFRRLLVGEPGAYWTFAIHAGDVTMAGATPERHVSVQAGTVTMNPIAGTYRHPASGPTGADLLRFLADPKETEELFMVVDEELKMMSQVCGQGGQVLGPYLKEMGHLAHTEYLLRGQTDLDVREVLRETMFAPTVTGSPIENAARVIARHEATGRGYYSGLAALIGQDDAGRQVLDAPILIRTAYLDPSGEVRVPVGATLVRHSNPDHEAAETRAKVAGILAALGLHPSGPANSLEPAGLPRPANSIASRLNDHPGVTEALAARNAMLAPFWLRPQAGGPRHDGPPADEPRRAGLAGRSALIIDAEDRWTSMLAHLLRHLGMTATVRQWDDLDDAETDRYDLLVGGPGPGDPRQVDDPRIGRLRQLMSGRLASGQPLLAVCLSHQILAGLLDFPLTQLARPYQGTQRQIDLFGRSVRAGFYNTFAARLSGTAPDGLDVATDPATGEIHALRGTGFASVQFHLESILSTDGIETLGGLLDGLVTPVAHPMPESRSA